MPSEDLELAERAPPDLPMEGGAFRQTLMFGDQASAMRFMLQLIDRGPTAAVQGSSGLFPMSIWDEMMEETGAVRVARSTLRKETRVYRYQSSVHAADLHYLEERDPTAGMLISDVPRDAWLGLPKTGDEHLDEYFGALETLGYPQAAADAHSLARRDGMALLYWIGGGRASQPLSGPISGFTFIERSQLDDTDDQIEFSKRITPLQPHGIDFVTLKGEDNEELRIHGSRLQLFKNGRTRSIWGKSKVVPVFDDLWNLRDHVFALTRATFEGDPLAFEFMTEAVKNGNQIDLDLSAARGDITARDELKENAKRFVTGALQVFSPVQGITVKRVGGARLPDPTPGIRLIASRLSHGFEHTVNHILASSRGSEQTTGDDDARYAYRIDAVRRTICLPLLNHAVSIGKFIGDVGGEVVLRPDKLRWPEVRSYNMRERAYAYSTFTRAVDMAEKWNRDLPAEIVEMFPERQGPPRFPTKAPSEQQQQQSDGPPQSEAIVARLDEIDLRIEETQQLIRERRPIVEVRDQ